MMMSYSQMKHKTISSVTSQTMMMSYLQTENEPFTVWHHKQWCHIHRLRAQNHSHCDITNNDVIFTDSEHKTIHTVTSQTMMSYSQTQSTKPFTLWHHKQWWCYIYRQRMNHSLYDITNNNDVIFKDAAQNHSLWPWPSSVAVSTHDAVVQLIGPYWRTNWPLSYSSHCSTTGETKANVYLKNPLLLIRKSITWRLLTIWQTLYNCRENVLSVSFNTPFFFHIL